jgi:hypothetical protein
MVDGCPFISGCTFYIYLNSFYIFLAVEFFDFPLGRSLGSTWQPKQAERFLLLFIFFKKKRIMYTFIVDGQFLIAATGHLFCLTKLASTTQRPTCLDSHCLTLDPAASSSWPLPLSFAVLQVKLAGCRENIFSGPVSGGGPRQSNKSTYFFSSKKFMNGAQEEEKRNLHDISTQWPLEHRTQINHL